MPTLRIGRVRLTYLLIAALLLTAAPLSAANAAAPMASIKRFQASCRTFSVDVAVTGVTLDQDGFDRFRFEVIDGRGQLLYSEDSARQVGVSDQAFVVSLPFVAGAVPTANPLRFRVIDTDMIARPLRVVAELATESMCFPAANPAARLAEFLAEGVKGTTRTESILYPAPDSDPLPLTVPAKREFTALYRNADSSWVALYVGGENLVWVRRGDWEGDVAALRLMPDRIDRSQQVTGAVLPGPALATARIRYNLNIRLGPSTAFVRIGRVPARNILPVYGRNTTGGWVLITYKGISGWVSTAYITLEGVSLRDLPIVG
ncbi:MAG TPA: SH3 domain-containing protein [Aggregatilineales bacterium]|nr:SH3 domain-containing protein [Anaerolineales bacterium]HRE48473.1 SH3 domain-containing protein [Aggregatilineales bacterium]